MERYKDNQYVAFRTFDFMTLSGETRTIPRGMHVVNHKGRLITFDGEPICNVHSERGQQYFAWDGDGEGILRGLLTYAIAHAVRPRREGFRFNSTEQEELQDKYGELLEKGSGIVFNDYFYHLPIGALSRMAERFYIMREDLERID